MKKTTKPHEWGSGQGRGHHPADPSGHMFGPRHWPLAAPHERGDYTGRTAGFKKPDPVLTPQTKDSKPREVPSIKPAAVSSSTGLVTRDDFLKEAEKLGVLDATLTTKIAKCFVDPAPNEGMRRMRANNLLRNALKRKAAT